MYKKRKKKNSKQGRSEKRFNCWVFSGMDNDATKRNPEEE